MAAAAILKNRKSRYLRNRLTDFDAIWYGDAHGHSGSFRALQFALFKNQDGGRPPSWKIEKWENKPSSDCLFSTKYLCQKLLKSNNACSSYSEKCRGVFFETQCRYIDIPFFHWLLHKSDPSTDFDARWLQTTRLRPRMCLFGVSLIWLPILVVKFPKNPHFGGVNRHFQAKMVK